MLLANGAGAAERASHYSSPLMSSMRCACVPVVSSYRRDVTAGGTSAGEIKRQPRGEVLEYEARLSLMFGGALLSALL
jgi:hypothetical protein